MASDRLRRAVLEAGQRAGAEACPAEGEIVLNAPLAAEIGAAVGDEVLAAHRQRQPDSARQRLGRKTETDPQPPPEGFRDHSRRRDWAASTCIPTSRLPRDAFVAIETLQDALEQPGKVNAIFVAGREGLAPTPAARTNVLAEQLASDA